MNYLLDKFYFFVKYFINSNPSSSVSTIRVFFTPSTPKAMEKLVKTYNGKIEKLETDKANRSKCADLLDSEYIPRRHSDTDRGTQGDKSVSAGRDGGNHSNWEKELKKTRLKWAKQIEQKGWAQVHRNFVQENCGEVAAEYVLEG